MIGGGGIELVSMPAMVNDLIFQDFMYHVCVCTFQKDSERTLTTECELDLRCFV